jgi:hypothetical protein
LDPDPNPDPKFITDPDPKLQIISDPDPQPWLLGKPYGTRDDDCFLGKCVIALNNEFWEVWHSMDIGSDIMMGLIKWIRQTMKIISLQLIIFLLTSYNTLVYSSTDIPALEK